MPQAGALSFFPFTSGRTWTHFLKRVGIGQTVRIDSYKLHAGEGQPVVVLPDYTDGPESTLKLRERLESAGFSAHDWGLGPDVGPQQGFDRLVRRLEERIIDIYEAERRPVTLLALGLSGIYAREVAKRISPLVRRVITVGSPVRVDDPQGRCFMLRSLYAPQARIDALKFNRLRQRPPVPCTSIFTVTDEAVPSSLSEDPESITTENLMVPARRHADLIRHPKTLEAITERLARAEEEHSLF
jgi:hypothetical protein